MKLLAILCLALCSCAAPVGRLNPGAAIPYEITDQLPPRTAGQTNGWWIHERYLDGSPFIAAHECAHVAEMRGITYRQAIDLLTPPNPSPHMQRRLASMHKIADMGPDYWQNIKDTWGASAVQHESILARLK